IKITERDGKKAVSARELHTFLGCTERFANWFERQLQFGFDENHDYVGCKTFNALANQELNDYAISLDMAKEVSMLQRSEKGKQARKYFLDCEKVAMESKKILTQAEIVLQMAQLNVENERRILSLESENKEIKEQVMLIDARTQTRPDYFSVIGFSKLNRINVGLKRAAALGKVASSLCKSRRIETEKVADQRFGKVNTYPSHVLREVFETHGYSVTHCS
ncbi:MAG: antA/AntB antirepressor family protein, partial [Niameybacter sp.]